MNSIGPNTNVDTEFKKAIELIEKLSSHTEFCLPRILLADWKDLPKGTKLSLGRKIAKEADKEVSFKRTQRDSSNLQWYIKL